MELSVVSEDSWNVDRYLARHCAKCNGSVEKTQTRQKERNKLPISLPSLHGTRAKFAKMRGVFRWTMEKGTEWADAWWLCRVTGSPLPWELKALEWVRKRRGHSQPRAGKIQKTLHSSTILHIIFIHSTNIWVPSMCQTQCREGISKAWCLFL